MATDNVVGLLGQVAQSVEQGTENPCVGGSIPPLATIKINSLCNGLSRSVFRISPILALAIKTACGCRKIPYFPRPVHVEAGMGADGDPIL